MTRAEIILRLVLSAVLLAVAVSYTIIALDFHELARYAPVAAGGLSSVLLLAVVVREVVRLRRYDVVTAGSYSRSIEHVEEGEEGVTTKSLLAAVRYAGWIVGFLALVWFFGLEVAAALFVGSFLRLDAEMSWRFTAISVAAVMLFLWVFGTIIGFEWPEGVYFPL